MGAVQPRNASVTLIERYKRILREAATKDTWKGDFLSGFWAWHDLSSFIIALGVFTSFWSLLTLMLLQYQWYVEALGMVSLLVEASLGAPQLLRNFKRKSTQGMRLC
ncbi:unnamed protein product [Heligmosomoides polygyrus]|uniref:Transmembrane protein n=1 Tax=Heligmosomoides polygyrus TaxID=6339 RepID=A0A183FPN4_HELPZ|nr:unnamed protein product [Heligmosomoides polygyrus]